MNAIYKHLVEGCVRYIGETKLTPEERLLQHWRESRSSRRNSHRLNLLRSLKNPPSVEVIEYVSEVDAEAREKHWIALARAYGCKLTNATDGGEGMVNLPAEVRARMGDTKRGRPLTEMHKQSLRAAQQKRRARADDITPEFRQRMSKLKTGTSSGPMPPQTKAALRAANAGKKLTPEAIAKRQETRWANHPHYFQ